MFKNGAEYRLWVLTGEKEGESRVSRASFSADHLIQLLFEHKLKT